ncbi:precorrin-8X methylmutase [Desulfococcaceae bacterium HSG8]|nr:precorrin-8X methylmutase [Desulfococcaceae bacterium HSG8]
MNPNEIEKLSFAIIDKEAGPHEFDPEAWSIVRRMIHTSADFGYMQSVCFHPDAIRAGIRAIRTGKNIITDTEMLRAGIRKKSLEKFGGKALCLIGDPDVSDASKKAGTTRSHEAVNRSVKHMEGGIYAVGNAPTALLRLIELIRKNRAKPTLVLGFPVGFVNAAESKALLTELDFPYITNKGRRGGSNIAASVVNALIILAEQQTGRK